MQSLWPFLHQPVIKLEFHFTGSHLTQHDFSRPLVVSSTAGGNVDWTCFQGRYNSAIHNARYCETYSDSICGVLSGCGAGCCRRVAGKYSRFHATTLPVHTLLTF